MDNIVTGSVGRVLGWLTKHHVQLIIALSLVHIRLSCIHVRDSGGADSRDAAHPSLAS
jgi:hypothetical protein